MASNNVYQYTSTVGMAAAMPSEHPDPDDLTMRVENQHILKIAGTDNYRCTLRVSEEKVYSPLIDVNEAYRYYAIYVAAGQWRGFTDKTLPDFIKIQLSLVASYKGDAHPIYAELPSPYDEIGWPLSNSPRNDKKYYVLVLSKAEVTDLRSIGRETYPVVEVDLIKYHGEIAAKKMEEAKQYGQMAQQKMQAQQIANQQQAAMNQLKNQYQNLAGSLGSTSSSQQNAWNSLGNTTNHTGNVTISPAIWPSNTAASSQSSASYIQMLKDWWNADYSKK